ncbi:hypothetical protein KY328_05760 [Candidatus Woesearchaeota archaeon]|nr:hypothetical protein [Candidatus Woesearchaeota archaeon]MBW3022405.1 hypothetical protein [Candidatus Woesearchaeota archaeon]
MPEVRVSCSGYAYMNIDDKSVGHYSRSKLERTPPKWFMGPFGGKHIHNDSADAFMRSLRVRYESAQRQLNLWLPETYVERFAEWFYSRDGREVIPLRELGEELVDEERVFSHRNTPFTLDKGFTLRKLTERAGGGPPTFYFFDIYRMQLEDYDTFRQAELREGCGVRLVTRAEIANRKMDRPGTPEHGAEVGDMFQYFGLDQRELEAIVSLNAKDKVSVTAISDKVLSFEAFL